MMPGITRMMRITTDDAMITRRMVTTKIIRMITTITIFTTITMRKVATNGQMPQAKPRSRNWNPARPPWRRSRRPTPTETHDQTRA